MADFFFYKARWKLKKNLTEDKWFTGMCDNLYPLSFAG